MPEKLNVDRVTGKSVYWPKNVNNPDRVPAEMRERLLGCRLLREILYRADADHVLLAIEEGTDMRRVGALEIVLEDLDVALVVVAPHPDGAIGLMRIAVQSRISDLPPTR